MSKKSGKDSPFGALQGLRDRLMEQEKGKAEERRKQKLEQQKKSGQAAALVDENELLARAMSGVKRLGPGGSKPRKKPPAPASAVRAQTSGTGLSTSDDDDEVMNNLRDLVEGRAPLDFTDSDEFVEGRAADCSRLDLSRLRDGVFAIQDTLDLHGHNREEAFAAVLGFFAESLKRGYRCVNVICGRGLHTPGGVPVLKELLVRWLVQGRLSYNVLAFSSAKRHDGGVGAIYVLLRRNPKRV